MVTTTKAADFRDHNAARRSARRLRRNRPEIRSGRAGDLGTNFSEDVHVRAQASRARQEAAIARAVMPPAA
jgi:hypothetical protein